MTRNQKQKTSAFFCKNHLNLLLFFVKKKVEFKSENCWLIFLSSWTEAQFFFIHSFLQTYTNANNFFNSTSILLDLWTKVLDFFQLLFRKQMFLFWLRSIYSFNIYFVSDRQSARYDVYVPITLTKKPNTHRHTQIYKVKKDDIRKL